MNSATCQVSPGGLVLKSRSLLHGGIRDRHMRRDFGHIDGGEDYYARQWSTDVGSALRIRALWRVEADEAIRFRFKANCVGLNAGKLAAGVKVDANSSCRNPLEL